MHPVALLAVWLAPLLAAPSTPSAASVASFSPSRPQPARPAIAAEPARPVEGTLFRVRARWPAGAPAPDTLRGEVGGEPLHFVRTAPGEFVALAAAPLGADTLPLRVEAAGEATGATAGTWTMPLAVARGDYRLERLRVAPQYGAEPAPALAARIASEAERARAVARASHDTPRLWEGSFAAPRPGRVTSPFGGGREYNGQVTSRHTGTDLAGAVGAPVRAPARGVVRLVDRFHLGGNVVYLDHGAGLTTAYLHLSRTDVAVGDTVARGATIGAVGATGRVTGPHLHWIVRYGGVSVDGARAIADSLP